MYAHIFDDPLPTTKRQREGCDHEGCEEKGEFRAPKNRLGDYYWFCLAHVRTYNSAWNYYQGIPDDDLEGHIRSDSTWHRPSWPLHARTSNMPMHNAFDVKELYAQGTSGRGHSKKDAGLDKPSHELQRALDLLELGYPFTSVELKRQFRILVKKYHPDANQNSHTTMDMIISINEAYALSKKSCM
jgi:hypothetical protein